MPGQQWSRTNPDGTHTVGCYECGWVEEHGWDSETATHALHQHLPYVRRLWKRPQHGPHDYLAPPLRSPQHAESLAIYRDGKHLIRAACDFPGCGWLGPERPRADVATADFVMHRADLSIVLTDIDTVSGSVVALPLVWAAARLRAYATLLWARTFGEARADPYAAWLVDESVPVWIEDEREIDGRAVRGRDHDPFEAEELWGIDGWRIWRAEPLDLQAEFLDSDAPAAASFLEAGQDRLLIEESPPVVPVAARVSFEGAINASGWTVKRMPGLVALFDSPPDDPWQALPTAPEPWIII